MKMEKALRDLAENQRLFLSGMSPARTLPAPRSNNCKARRAASEGCMNASASMASPAPA
jgi:hypothetical protein